MHNIFWQNLYCFYAFDNVGPALLITTVVLTAGFSVLMLSTFKLNFELGLITAMTITIALIVDFLLLPAMLLIFDKAPYKQLSKVAEIAAGNTLLKAS